MILRSVYRHFAENSPSEFIKHRRCCALGIDLTAGNEHSALFADKFKYLIALQLPDLLILQLIACAKRRRIIIPEIFQQPVRKLLGIKHVILNGTDEGKLFPYFLIIEFRP